MFQGYKAAEEMVRKISSSCNDLVMGLDETDAYEGVLILLVKNRARDELVNRCAMLVLDQADEEDLRGLFGDELYDEGVRLYERMRHEWSVKRLVC